MASKKVNEDSDSSEETPPDEFENYIKELYKRKGLSEINVAKKMGLSNSYLNKWVRGASKIGYGNYAKFRRLRKALGIENEQWSEIIDLGLEYSSRRFADEVKREGIAKEECFILVREEIEELLKSPSAKLLLEALTQIIVESNNFPKQLQKGKDNAEGIAEFIVDLHRGEEAQRVHITIRDLLVEAVELFRFPRALGSKLENANLTDERMKELLYLLLGWILHLALADHYNLSSYREGNLFYLPVETGIGVEMYMAVESERSVTLVDHDRVYMVGGESRIEGEINSDIGKLNRENYEGVVNTILVDLWNTVLPKEEPRPKNHQFTESEKEELKTEINYKKERKGRKRDKDIDPYVAFPTPDEDVKNAFKKVAELLHGVIDDLAIVAFNFKDKTTGFLREKYIKASIRDLYDSMSGEKGVFKRK